MTSESVILQGWICSMDYQRWNQTHAWNFSLLSVLGHRRALRPLTLLTGPILSAPCLLPIIPGASVCVVKVVLWLSVGLRWWLRFRSYSNSRKNVCLLCVWIGTVCGIYDVSFKILYIMYCMHSKLFWKRWFCGAFRCESYLLIQSDSVPKQKKWHKL